MISAVQLDRLCAEDGFVLLNPPEQSPDIIPDDYRIDVVETDGTVRRRLFPEDVTWWKAIAWKAETSFGAAIDVENYDDWDDWEGFAEPAPQDTSEAPAAP